jgi:site-specific DNA-methyltransferase (adenine-specific)
VRDSIAWLYGSGFPKSLDISKAIDKAAGAEREVIGSKIASSKGIKVAELRSDTAAGSYGGEAKEIDITAPATPEAKEWAGWGTALKPAFEPIVVARKPLIGTVAANVLEWGTGGLNIDGNRIGTGETKTVNYPDIRGGNYGQDGEAYADRATVSREIIDKGRWPANIILDEYTAGLVDEQSGHLTSGALKAGRKVAHTNVDFMQGLDFHTYESPANSGGASRFFYIAKASRRDRNEGLEALDKEKSGAVYNERLSGGLNAHLHGEDSKPQKNFHPTVKPTTLMEYLIKLVTPPGGTVLDPFTGSGSTGKAALLNGFEFIGIELTADYLPIIEGRLTHAQNTKNEGLF